MNQFDDIEPGYWQYVKIWSLQYTLEELCYPGKKVAFPSLDGIRALSMCWVLLGHTVAFDQGNIANMADGLQPHGMLSTFTGQVFVQGPLSVDSFFFLSGFLGTYLCIKKLKLKDGNLPKLLSKVPWIYILRWLRLAIPLIFVMLWMIGISPLLYLMGPRHPAPPNCIKENFIYNMLFVVRDAYSGLDGLMNICVGQTWYLQVDMRVFLFIPIVGVVYNFSPEVCLFGSFVAWLVGCVITGHEISKYDVSPILINTPDLTDPAHFDELYDLYFAIRFRYAAMVVGIIFGIIWHRYVVERGVRKWSQLQAIIIFCFMSIFLMTSCYGAYSSFQHPACGYIMHDSEGCGSHWSKAEKIWFGALNHSVWCMGLACLCALCFTDQFPFANAMLSHDFWKPIARLSFMMYLTQIEVSQYFHGNQISTVRYTTWWLVWSFCAFFGTTALAAVFFHCLVEAPFNKLVKFGFSKIMPPPPKKDALLAKGEEARNSSINSSLSPGSTKSKRSDIQGTSAIISSNTGPEGITVQGEGTTQATAPTPKFVHF